MRQRKHRGLVRRELGDGFGSFRHGVLGEFSGKHETDRSLNLATGESGLFVVGGKLTRFTGDTFKDIVDEGVHDGHTLLADSSIGVDLLQDLVDVRRVRFHALLGLAAAGTSLLGRLGRLLGGCLGHCYLLES